MKMNWIQTTTREAHISFQIIVLYESNFENGYINTLRMRSFYIIFCITSKTVTSGHGKILVMSSNTGIKSFSQPGFGLESSGTVSRAPIYYLTG